MGALSRISVEDLALVTVLVFFGMAGSLPGIAPNQASEMTGTPATQLQAVVGIGTQFLVNGVIVWLLLRHRRFLLRQRALLGWAASLALWAVASTLWSQAPMLTARRALAFALATGFAMVLALRVEKPRLLLLLQAAFAILACGSAVLALGFPTLGLDASTGHGGDWQGVFTQKNACGRAMVFALATVFASGRFSTARVALAFIFTAELILSGSRGAWLLGAVLVVGMLLFRFACMLDRASRSALLAATAVLALGAASIAATQFADLALLLGRDPTLTGRTAIWQQVWLAILHAPVLGYGFSAFWRGAQGVSWQVVVALKFVLFHAHNGFLEIWLELGGAGLLLFVLGYGRAVILLLPEVLAGRYRDAAWPGSMLMLIALYDGDENTLLSFNGLFWVLYACALVQVEQLAAQRRLIRRLTRAAAQRRQARSGNPFGAQAPLSSYAPGSGPGDDVFATPIFSGAAALPEGAAQRPLPPGSYPSERSPWL